MSTIKNKAELLLVLLYAGEKLESKVQKSTPVEGITRLEKLLFLLTQEAGFLSNVAKKEDGFDFIPFRLGPWSNEVYDTIDFLESIGLLSRNSVGKLSPEDEAHDNELFGSAILDRYQKNMISTDEKTEVYSLSIRGIDKAVEVWQSLDPKEKRLIVELKQKFNPLNLKQLLRYVYKKYPQFTTESEIKDSL